MILSHCMHASPGVSCLAPQRAWIHGVGRPQAWTSGSHHGSPAPWPPRQHLSEQALCIASHGPGACITAAGTQLHITHPSARTRLTLHAGATGGARRTG